MPSYQFWTEQARRWQACVDYGSPISAWTSEMHRILEECGQDKVKADAELRNWRAEACEKS